MIALKDVLDQGFVSRAIILVIVAVLITAVVYGVVALIVKMDDVGLRMAQSTRPLDAADRARARHRHAQAAGRPVRRRDRRDGLGRRAHPARRRRRARMARALRPRAPPRGPRSTTWPASAGVLAWLVNTLASAIVGLAVGTLAVAVVAVAARVKAVRQHRPAAGHD